MNHTAPCDTLAQSTVRLDPYSHQIAVTPVYGFEETHNSLI